MGSAEHRKRQMAEAEELFGDRLAKAGFAKALYFGEYKNEKLLPYPDIYQDEDVNRRVADLRKFCETDIDPVQIDKESEIPRKVIDGLGRLGVLGACMPKEYGGAGLNQTAYCRLLEVLGYHCGSTALFVNAHHSIGPRALVLFGTPEQQQQWIPPMASGEWISAFALTEPEAGSDAANVQTRAEPTPDGKGYLLNGEKRWITNGSQARMLIVMARTPVPNSNETKITAFQVDSTWPGFEVVEARMDKMGVRGTATAKLKFTNLFVPNENILGQLGKGLKIALTVLDFGRTTFGATCTGAAKFCCERSVEHANRRVQFGQKLSAFELVKEKIAYMHAGTYAMEAMTYQTAALIDSGEDDYMLETAMLKVFNTEVLWRILNDTFQLHGGMAYFKDQPFERMVRDARINTIGEGSNDVLRSFIALVGMRDVGLELESILSAIKKPLRNVGRLSAFAGKKLEQVFAPPHVHVHSTALEADAVSIARSTQALGAHIEKLLRTYQEEVLDRQYQLARVSDAATQLYACGCVLSRLDHVLSDPHLDEKQKQEELAYGRHYLLTAKRRIKNVLANAWDNDDLAVTSFADRVLGGEK